VQAQSEPIKVILNPHSGRGQGGRSLRAVRSALEKAGLRFDIEETQAPGHGIELARMARAAGHRVIVAAGGDGTVSEVVNGMAQATPVGETVGTLALFPIGSGNDLADMTGVPRDLDAAAQRIVAGRTRRIDLGRTLLHGPKGVVERYFDNNLGIGFEAKVTLESYKIRSLRGTLLYLVAALRALRSYQAPQVDIAWETDADKYESTQQTVLLISVGNSPRTGGGFYLVPEARLDDGLMDVGIAEALSRPRILMLLPRVMVGSHTSAAEWTSFRCRKLTVSCRGTIPVHLDGEVVMADAQKIEVTLQPSRLEIIV
jgi:diacylglycerol kinase (ATP)